MDDIVELKAIRYGRRRATGRSGYSDDFAKSGYIRDPYKFLWRYTGERTQERQRLAINNDRTDTIHQQAQGKIILGMVLNMEKEGLPGYGSLYQQEGSNFILHSDNLERVIKIPYYTEASNSGILSDKSWYLDSLSKTLLLFNLIYLVFTVVALIEYVKITVYLKTHLISETILLKRYMSIYLTLIMLVAFLFSIGNSLVITKIKSYIYIYLFLCFVTLNMMILFVQMTSHIREIYTHSIFFYRHVMVDPLRLRDIERFQSMNKCCGLNNPLDWIAMGHKSLPHSCCTSIFNPAKVGVFDCEFENAHSESCSDFLRNFYANTIKFQFYMFRGQIFFQWLALVLAVMYTIGLYNHGDKTENNINYDSNIPTEYFNIVAKGEVEFHLPLAFYNKRHTHDFKYMILMNDIRQAINESQNKYLLERKYMMFDVV